MTTTLNNSYLVKVSTLGGGGSKLPKILSTWFVHAPFVHTLLREKSSFRMRMRLHTIPEIIKILRIVVNLTNLLQNENN